MKGCELLDLLFLAIFVAFSTPENATVLRKAHLTLYFYFISYRIRLCVRDGWRAMDACSKTLTDLQAHNAGPFLDRLF